MVEKKRTVPLTAAVLQNFSGQASETWKDENGIDMYITYINLHNKSVISFSPGQANILPACFNVNMQEPNC